MYFFVSLVEMTNKIAHTPHSHIGLEHVVEIANTTPSGGR